MKYILCATGNSVHIKTAAKFLVILFSVVFVSNTALAQKEKKKDNEKTDASRFNWEKSKLVPKLKKLAIAELTVSYKLTTTAKTIAQEKDTRKIAGARVTAYLETTDSDLTQDDFQGITDHFYNYFQKKLKENGIDTVDGTMWLRPTSIRKAVAMAMMMTTKRTAAVMSGWFVPPQRQGHSLRTGRFRRWERKAFH